MKLALYFHTLRHMRPVQIGSRLAQRLRRPAIDRRPAPPLRPTVGDWLETPAREPRMFASHGFRFLNRQRELSFPAGWNDPAVDQLWLYNLHYFEDLFARDAAARRAWHLELVERWPRENPPFEGRGWDPYPLSLRIVSWIKWSLAGEVLSAAVLDSLAQQTRNLAQRIEYHLLGNHLLANAKALVFAGLYFAGDEADRWLRQGCDLFCREFAEQILPDGAHFELSPMYHALILEDVLDLLNLWQVYRVAPESPWRELATRMRHWLAAMCLPDGRITLFNDAAFGIAPEVAELDAYAARLGLPPIPAPTEGITHLADSGYVRLQHGDAVAVVDVGEIGPAYIPGHGHADVLGLEFALGPQRVIVNSGTSVYYGNDRQRERERATAAHNSVEVDGHSSSELWGNFRVARRAHPCGLRVQVEGETLVVSCAHDGYRRLPGRVTHRRTFTLEKHTLTIEDQLEGSYDQAYARFHLHPEVVVTFRTASEFELQAGAWQMVFTTNARECRVEATQYHPEFGLAVPNRCLVVPVEQGRATCKFAWGSQPAAK
ncbi:MAG: alginate lyase family protein [Pirellulales bacterium]|nr:alginate lyase family protein [Pirellulales bacterium]